MLSGEHVASTQVASLACILALASSSLICRIDSREQIPMLMTITKAVTITTTKIIISARLAAFASPSVPGIPTIWLCDVGTFTATLDADGRLMLPPDV